MGVSVVSIAYVYLRRIYKRYDLQNISLKLTYSSHLDLGYVGRLGPMVPKPVTVLSLMFPKTNHKYDPLKAGSIDGTDSVPHDRAICRALRSSYKHPQKCSNDYCLFVGRIPSSVTQDELQNKFAAVGKIESCHLVRDLVTGISKGYAFIEYVRENDAVYAYHEMNGILLEGRAIIVDWKVSDLVPSWIPRRLGGGWGGKKESGQLRFGCRDRPWHRPIVIPPVISSAPKIKRHTPSFKINNSSPKRYRK